MPPDVKIRGADFTPNGEGIRFGLAAIKNVGRNAIDSILAARAKLAEEAKRGFTSLWEFCELVDLRLLNKRVIESLIKAGALDSFGPRAQLMAAVDKAMERAQKSQRDLAAGQSGLFGGLGAIFDEAPVNGTGGLHGEIRCPTCRTGMRICACSRRRRCWASSSPGIRWTNMRTRSKT